LLPVGYCQIDDQARIYAIRILNKKQVEDLPSTNTKVNHKYETGGVITLHLLLCNAC